MKNKNPKCQNLLIEIGTEEIPAGYLEYAVSSFRDNLLGIISNENVNVDVVREDPHLLCSPRRIAVFIPDVPEYQEDQVREYKGPPSTIAYDENGKLTHVALSFAKKFKAKKNELEKRKTDKGEYIYFVEKITGAPVKKVLPELIISAIKNIKFPKSMRWGNGELHFARPVRWIVALLGQEIIPIQLNGVKSGNKSRGHRILSTNKPLIIKEADIDLYKEVLKQGRVIVDFNERKEIILDKIDRVLGNENHIEKSDRSRLVDEVANLVEWPEIALGSFQKSFLELPKEILVTSMRHHQRYFPVFNSEKMDQLLPEFIVIFNGSEKIMDQVLIGNERVLRARLADASFFWNEDRKKTLEERVPELKSLLFQEKLGSYFDKTQRLVALSKDASILGDKDPSDELTRACLLSKADLVAEMVKEHPVLQGVMGGLYARESGEKYEVSLAIKEQYLPLTGSTGNIPSTFLGRLLAVIDKVDTLTGGFYVGLETTGSSDPYALRRHGMGLLRILYESGLDLDLLELIRSAAKGYQIATDHECLDKMFKFLEDRFCLLMTSEGYSHDLVEAVVQIKFCKRFCNPYHAYQVIKALASIREQNFFKEAVTVVERTYNITKNVGDLKKEIEESLLQEPEEIALYRTYQSHYHDFSDLSNQGKYVQATEVYSKAFAEPVHAFFDKVLVNVDHKQLRENRLVLCRTINRMYADTIADISKLVM